MPQLVGEAARRLGMASATVYLADVQEDQLVPLPSAGEGHGDGSMSLRLSRRRPCGCL